MKLWEIVVVAIVLFFVWGRVSKKVVPKSCIIAKRPLVPLICNNSAGDNFAGGFTPIAGVCEPETPVISYPAPRLVTSGTGDRPVANPIYSPHIFFPVNPPSPVPVLPKLTTGGGTVNPRVPRLAVL